MRWTRVLALAGALTLGAGGGALGVGLASGAPSGAPTLTTGETGPGPGGAPKVTGSTDSMMGGGMTSGSTMGGSMMGGGMMGGSTMGGGMSGSMGVPMGGHDDLAPAGHMESLATSAARDTSRTGTTLSYSGHAVTVVALAAPGSRPGMYWQLDGVDSVSVSVPSGAAVTVDFADGDPGYPHGFELTSAAPPYPHMAMMDAPIAAPGAFIMPVPPPDGAQWHAATVTFAAPVPGTYYIICPVPGHAQQGMWAKFVVR